MDVIVEERHYSSTLDVEGFEYDRNRMDDDSVEFEKYLDEFHVLEKYRKDRPIAYRSLVYEDEGKMVKKTVYFNGWVHIDGERPRKEMCYIIIEKPVNY
ncbi:MAG: hypothetical protein QXU18_00325 [Thermoplasmatales archaeon]